MIFTKDWVLWGYIDQFSHLIYLGEFQSWAPLKGQYNVPLRHISMVILDLVAYIYENLLGVPFS